MARLLKTAALTIVIVGVSAFSTVTNAEDLVRKKKPITVAELQDLEVVGLLGEPLGTIITIEGVIADGSYTKMKYHVGRILLRVTRVNGKKLPKEEVFILSNDDKPKVGSEFKYIAYETGAFIGTPRRVFDYRGMYADIDYGFRTGIVVVRDELKPR